MVNLLFDQIVNFILRVLCNFWASFMLLGKFYAIFGQVFIDKDGQK